MAKARAILKRRKAVRNIKKITRTMQMIATAKFQKSLKRATGTKPYTLKVRELVQDLAASIPTGEEATYGDRAPTTLHPLLRRPSAQNRAGREALVVITSNRGLAGAYNPNVLKVATGFLRQRERPGGSIDLYVNGKKGVGFFKFQGRPITEKLEVRDQPAFAEVERYAQRFIDDFVAGRIDALHVAYMNFVSTGQQRPEVTTLLPLAGLQEAVDDLARQAAERDAQIEAGMLDTSRRVEADAPMTPPTNGHTPPGMASPVAGVEYDFSPDAQTLLDELLPLTVKMAFFQTFLDATTSEHVARMVAMKSATDNADKMGKALQLQYNRARQSQITTELSEIMGGVEAMK